jgi:hypothetical protein
MEDYKDDYRQNRARTGEQDTDQAGTGWRDRRAVNYNRPEYYNIKRREFGHGESGNMAPARTEVYGERSFRGFSQSPTTGRDYEENIGYREGYNRLGTDAAYYPGRQDQPKNETHRGKGPRSYQRADERILEDINDRLCDNPYIDASNVEVSVKDREVILTGSVDDREAKRLAEDIGESVSGVKNVENRLRVTVKGI